MAIMARSPTIPTTPSPVLAEDKLRQSMEDASATVERADETVARVNRHIMRCDALLRQLRLLADRSARRSVTR